MAKFGGKEAVLQGVQAGRIISAPNNKGMAMYFLPRLEYSRENLYKQRLSGEAQKASQSLSDLGNLQDSQFGFSWDPSQLVPAALDGAFAGVCSGGSNGGGASMPTTSTPLPLGPDEGWEGVWCVCVCLLLSACKV